MHHERIRVVLVVVLVDRPRRKGERSRRERYRAMKMLLDDRSEAEVARTFGVSREAVRKWKNAYLSDRLEPAEVGRPPRVPPERIARVVEQVARSPRRFGLSELWTVADLAVLLKRQVGVGYAVQSVHTMLRRLGYHFDAEAGWRRTETEAPPSTRTPWGFARDALGRLVREPREHGITCIVRHMRLVSRMSIPEIVGDLQRAGIRDRDGQALGPRQVSRMLSLSAERTKDGGGAKAAAAPVRRRARGSSDRQR